MSIASEINRLSGNVGDTLSALRNTGTSVPSGANSDSMAGLVSQYAGEVTAGKALVAAAVTEKGVETPADATFQQISDNIAAIESGGQDSSLFLEVKSPGEMASAIAEYSLFAIWEIDGCLVPIININTWSGGAYSIDDYRKGLSYTVVVEGAIITVSTTGGGDAVIAQVDLAAGLFDFSTSVTWRFFVPK